MHFVGRTEFLTSGGDVLCHGLLLIMGHGRRQILWFGVTAHPTAEWFANQ
ncbi:MAG: hypothetical protein ABIO35_06615 [Nitrobacter sp.]